MAENKPEGKSTSELNVITKAKDLVKHTFTITNSTTKFPKKYRFTLVNRMQNRVIEIYECLIEANELNLGIPAEKIQRQALQAKALTYCKELLFFIELSFEMQFISAGSCEYWSKLACDVKYIWRQLGKKGIAAEDKPHGVCIEASNSYNARNVNSDGTLNNNNAYNGNIGVRPLWW